MTRFWSSGDPIRVDVDDDGRPLAFLWRNQHHPIEGITQHWRVDAEWWILRIWRDYFKAYTRTGLLVIIFQDLLTGQWKLQRVYD